MRTTLFRSRKNNKTQKQHLHADIDQFHSDFAAFPNQHPMSVASYQPRPLLRRHSPLSVFSHAHGFAADASMIQSIDVGDSSDDELPQPMKFSALTTALLESEKPEHNNSPLQKKAYVYGEDSRRAVASRNGREIKPDGNGLDTPSRAPLLKIVRRPSPSAHDDINNNSSVRSPRLVQVGHNISGSTKRTISVARDHGGDGHGKEETSAQQYITPGPSSRNIRISRDRSGSNASLGTSGGTSASKIGSGHGHSNLDHTEDHGDYHETYHRSASAASGSDAGTRHVISTMARSRNASGESAAPPSSMRVKRVPIGAGSFLRGAPVRRGFRRRDSDENASPGDDNQAVAHNVQEGLQVEDEFAEQRVPHNAPGGTGETTPAEEHVSQHDWARASHRDRPTRDNSSNPTRPVSQAYPHRASTETSSRHPSLDRHSQRVDSGIVNTVAGLPGDAAKPFPVDALQVKALPEHPLQERRPSVSQHAYRAPPRLPMAMTTKKTCLHPHSSATRSMISRLWANQRRSQFLAQRSIAVYQTRLYLYQHINRRGES